MSIFSLNSNPAMFRASDELSQMVGRTVDLHTPGSLSRHFRVKVQREAQVQYVSATAA
jgi:predicted nucleotidyltransferase